MRKYGDMAPVFTAWFYEKYREQARLNGTQYAARNLRKQGVPLPLAVHILAANLSFPAPALDFTAGRLD